MIVIDSCGWIEYLADGPLADDYAPYFAIPDEIVTPSIVVYEVTKKIWRKQGKEKTVFIVAQMQQTKIIPFDHHLAVAAAEVSLLRGLPMADAIVYTTGMECGCKVVTGDRHFKDLPGVVFISEENA
ncbi:MAG: PIN domain protein [Desulfotomaculum sp. 46_296]|nr:MAG: PIN domain protein [Desulfotomaculum sp. 46_296]HAU31474.1 VapC toxin family PIN domain ribonuclease [Desulfotomaculum sp.]